MEVTRRFRTFGWSEGVSYTIDFDALKIQKHPRRRKKLILRGDFDTANLMTAIDS